jgi:formylglycine-generating enzyme required for sulfatase activity
MAAELVTIPEDMVLVPAGAFRRGSTESPDEQPVGLVAMSAFAIDRYPVTNRAFRSFMEAGGYENRGLWTASGWEFVSRAGFRHPNYWLDDHWNQDDHPVTGVSWWEALAYATWRGRALPTEAQWEYACRGLDDRRYPWGDDEPDDTYANFAPECEPAELRRRSTDVRAHARNCSYFGCYDMAGNLADWCLDNWTPSYEWDATRTDPVYVTAEEDYHVARGGCGLHSEGYLRCSSRDSYPPTLRDNIVGFRCALNHAQGGGG